MNTIKLVQNDTAPSIDVALTDESDGSPVDVSNAGDIVRFYFRKLGASALKATIVCTKPNGGADGLVRISWGASDLDTPGEYEGEIEITFNAGQKQSVYDILSLTIRAQVG
jgi:hypothetical protein